MKTIGMIGGMTWESSKEYYRIINQESLKRLGNHTLESIMHTIDFGVIDKLQHNDKWDEIAELVVKSAKGLELAGADFIVICTNSIHEVAPLVVDKINIPLLHIADATARAIKKQGMKRIGLLGTRFTMEHDFYKKKLTEEYGFEFLVPGQAERQIVHDVIYKELAHGKVLPQSREKYVRIIENLKSQGAEGVILGCTEIPLLVKQEDVSIHVFDTTEIHAIAAVDFALK